jgi:beta-mannosidase
LWQFNEPWPAISWAILDYFRRPKLAFHRLKWWYHPILICLEFKPGRDWQPGQSIEAMIWGVNDTLETVKGALQIELDGQLIFEAPSITLPPDDSLQLGELIHPLTRKPSEIRLVFQAGQTELSRNLYDLNWRDMEAEVPSKRFRRRVADLMLK